MESGYFFHYAEGNLVCIAILAIMLANDLRHSNLQEKQLCFNKTLVSFMLYFLNDIGWAAVLGGLLPRSRFLSFCSTC